MQDAEFTEWATGCQQQLLRTAYLLTGDSGRGLVSGYAGAAYLPVRGRTEDYGAGDALLARSWVSDHVLLLSVEPAVRHGGTVQRPRQVYLTWDTSTGELRRVGDTSQLWRDSSWAARVH